MVFASLLHSEIGSSILHLPTSSRIRTAKSFMTRWFDSNIWLHARFAQRLSKGLKSLRKKRILFYYALLR